MSYCENIKKDVNIEDLKTLILKIKNENKFLKEKIEVKEN